MARFDVYRYNDRVAPLVVDVQSDLLNELDTRVIIPLAPKENVYDHLLPKLKPALEIEGRTYLLITTDITVVWRSSLGQCVTNIENPYRQEITDSIDFLLQGF